MNCPTSQILQKTKNYFTSSTNYLPDYYPQVKRISNIIVSIISFLALLGIASIIAAIVLSQPLYLLGLGLAIGFGVLTLGIALTLLKKYKTLSQKTQNIPLDAVKNFSIVDKNPTSFSVNINVNNEIKKITFVNASPSQIFSPQHLSRSSLRKGYVCSVTKNGEAIHTLKDSWNFREVRNAWQKANKESFFSLGQTKSALMFTELEPNSIKTEDSASQSETEEKFYTPPSTPSPLSFTKTPFFLFLNHSCLFSSPLNQFCTQLQNAYKNLFASTTQKKIEHLYMPLLGYNPSLAESSTMAMFRDSLASKMLLKCLFEELANNSQLQKITVFINNNFAIEEILSNESVKLT